MRIVSRVLIVLCSKLFVVYFESTSLMKFTIRSQSVCQRHRSTMLGKATVVFLCNTVLKNPKFLCGNGGRKFGGGAGFDRRKITPEIMRKNYENTKAKCRCE